MPKNSKGGVFNKNPLGFSTFILSQNIKKMKGDPLGNFFPKKVSQCRKIEREPVCYAGKQEKPFWFSSLDQIVQFDAIIFSRTSNYFGQFVWIEKSH